MLRVCLDDYMLDILFCSVRRNFEKRVRVEGCAQQDRERVDPKTLPMLIKVLFVSVVKGVNLSLNSFDYFLIVFKTWIVGTC